MTHQIEPDSDVDSMDRTGAGPRQRTLRVSATARRVAAAYGDANQLPKKAKMLDCLLV